MREGEPPPGLDKVTVIGAALVLMTLIVLFGLVFFAGGGRPQL